MCILYFWTILVTLFTSEQNRSPQRSIREFSSTSNQSSMELSKSCDQVLTKDGFELSGFIFDNVSFEQFSDEFIFNFVSSSF